MGIFNNRTLKVRNETDQSRITYYIDYHRLKDEDLFVPRLLNKISQDENYFLIVDTKMMYKSTKNIQDQLDSLVKTLESLNLQYRELKVEGNGSISLFGASVNLNNKKKTTDTIVGIIASAETTVHFKQILNNFCIYYYTGLTKEISEEELLLKFEDNPNPDKLKALFDYSIFDSYFLKQITINTADVNTEFVSKTIKEIEKCF